MNPIGLTPRRNRKASRAWVFPLTFAAACFGLSIWGIKLCEQLFRMSLGPASSPTDSQFANLGARVAWILFFGPVAAVGILIARSTLEKIGAIDQFASWLSTRSRHSAGLPISNRHPVALASRSASHDPRGLENLDDKTVERLQCTARRIAILLGGLAGVSLLGMGIVGLIYLLALSKPYPGSSVYVVLATGRPTITFALFSGLSLLLGMGLLRRTFRKENHSWLLPLRVFTYAILRQGLAGRRARRSEPHSPETKSHSQS